MTAPEIYDSAAKDGLLLIRDGTKLGVFGKKPPGWNEGSFRKLIVENKADFFAWLDSGHCDAYASTLRQIVYGPKVTRAGFESVKHNWMKPESLRWLEEKSRRTLGYD